MKIYANTSIFIEDDIDTFYKIGIKQSLISITLTLSDNSQIALIASTYN